MSQVLIYVYFLIACKKFQVGGVAPEKEIALLFWFLCATHQIHIAPW